MIVDTDFSDHWKTKLLITESGDEVSVRCLLRLWAHCQKRKRWVFAEMDRKKLKAICDWPHDETLWMKSLIASKYVKINEADEFIVHEWDKYNRQLIQKWEAGLKGGRPRVNRPLTDRLSTANREQTGAKPIGDDRIGDDRKRTPISPKKRVKFTPPSLKEWLKRANEINFPSLDAESAWGYYDARGWKGITRWKSCVQTCFTRWKKENPDWKQLIEQEKLNNQTPPSDAFVKKWIKENCEGVKRLAGDKWVNWKQFSSIKEEILSAWKKATQ